jgi:hypothetical protein
MDESHLSIICRYPEWEFFGSLTFEGAPPGPKKAASLAINYFFRVAKAVNRPFPSLVWYPRVEEGGIGGRIHLHYLLGGTLLPRTRTGTSILKRVWERLDGRGFADVKVFDRSQNGPAYVVKCLADPGACQTDSAREYEVMRFATSQATAFPSNSLIRAVTRIQDEERKSRPAVIWHAPSWKRGRMSREHGRAESALRNGASRGTSATAIKARKPASPVEENHLGGVALEDRPF